MDTECMDPDMSIEYMGMVTEDIMVGITMGTIEVLDITDGKKIKSTEISVLFIYFKLKS